MKKIRRYILIIVFIHFSQLLLSQISYMYSDGNMNSYTVKEFEVRFDPVQKEESSSGMYSGGEPKVKVITPHELLKLTVLFEEAISDSSAQQPKRSMGSALLIRYNKTTVEKKIILKIGSSHKTKIEEQLKAFLE